jgi:hypothetical protein
VIPSGRALSIQTLRTIFSKHQKLPRSANSCPTCAVNEW